MDKSLILVEDLHRTVEHMYGGTATVTFRTNENIWEIRGYKKDLVVMLHYQNHCIETDEISGSGDTIFIKEEPTDVGNMNHQNESNLDINCPDDAVVHENRISGADGSTRQSTNVYTSQSTRCRSTSGEETIPELDVVCAITNNVSGEIGYSQSFKPEPHDEIKPNYDHRCHSNYESIINEVMSIIEEDAVEFKMFQLSQNTGIFEQGPAKKLQTEPVCESNDTNTSPMEDDSIVGNVEMMKLKNCFVLLEPLAITNLKINYLPATLEPDTFSMTNQVMSDGGNGFSVECCKCRKNFCTKPNLESHVKTVENINLCSGCENSADCQSDIVNVQSKDHVLHHCSECSISFCDLDSFNSHKQNKHPKNSECEELQWNDLESIEKPSHSSSHDEKLKKPMEKQTLIPSTLTHAGLEPFQYSSCGKKFSLKDSLRKHERIHSGVKPYKCSQCDKKFSRKYTLKIHELTHTEVKPYECMHCGKIFVYKHNLNRHELNHSGAKPYKCSQCDEKFSWKDSLKIHELKHAGVEPFECMHCGKKFYLKRSLKRHERSHSGVKPYRCSQCDKQYALKKSLTIHELMHTGVKPHKCSQCDKKFYRKDSLTIHELNHSGVKSHKCSQCNKTFYNKSNLRKHKRIHSAV